MRRNRVVWSLLAVALAAGGGVSHAAGEVSILATSVDGDYGGEADVRAQWLTLRYVAGQTIQFRAELPMIRTETLAPGIAYTGLGPISNGGRGSGLGATRPVASASESSSSVGDVRLALSRQVVGGGAALFRLDAGVEVKLPTADERRNLGTGAWDYRVGLAGEYRFWSASVFGGLGWNALGDAPSVVLDDVVDAYLGVDSEPFAGERLIATGWLEGWQRAVAGTDHRAALGAGIRTTGTVRWRLQVRAGLTDASEDLAVVAGLSFGLAPRGPGARGHER